MYETKAYYNTPRYVLPTISPEVRRHQTDVLVVGGGITGLMAALRAAKHHARVTLVTREALLLSNSAWAQGGIAAALDIADSPASHVEDTLIAGAGLSDHAAVEKMVWEAPRLMHELADLGVPFEREHGKFVLGLEGSHSQRRILHVGDTTGWAVTSTLVKRVRADSRIRVLEGYQAIDLITAQSHCTGLLALDGKGALHHFSADATILATGGASALYRLTSNQPGAIGEGIALAYRAGAEVCDMEFVQFHPTVFRTHTGQGFLISEAVRGEGAILHTASGYRFMPDYDQRAELAPRDVVTRGIFDAMRQEGSDYVLLNLTHLSRTYLQKRFPTIYARCCEEGIDPAVEPIPVAPAAHYLMGGIRTDLHGATRVHGLYAAGECACNGFHGANRLASNSLLECLVTGEHAATAAVNGKGDSLIGHMAGWTTTTQPMVGIASIDHMPTMGNGLSLPCGMHITERGDGHVLHTDVCTWQSHVSRIMCAYAGPLRSADGLQRGLHELAALPKQAPAINSDSIKAANATLVAALVLQHALLRQESRGAHFRVDFPYPVEDWRRHIVLGNGHMPYTVNTVAEHSAVPDMQDVYTPEFLPVASDLSMYPCALLDEASLVLTSKAA